MGVYPEPPVAGISSAREAYGAGRVRCGPAARAAGSRPARRSLHPTAILLLACLCYLSCWLLCALCWPRPAHALEFSLWGQPLRLDINYSMLLSYHGDSGERSVDKEYGDLFNRLNLTLSGGKLTLGLRLDTATFFNATPPEGKTIRYRDDYRIEKSFFTYGSRLFEGTGGDFYVVFGRGLTLALRKIDELGVDTTLQGGKLLFHARRIAATAICGFTNIVNVDQASGVYQDDPYDLLCGGRVEGRLGPVAIGAHGLVDLFHQNQSVLPEREHDDREWLVGGTFELPDILGRGNLYLEGAYQRREIGLTPDDGYAVYGSTTIFAGRLTALVEGKHYHKFQVVGPKQTPYNQPPTLERVDTELGDNTWVSGTRLRLDLRATRNLLVYASYAYFRNFAMGPEGTDIQDPYAGLELRWQQGRSHAFVSAGYRRELELSRQTVFKQDIHAEYDLAQMVSSRWSLAVQGKHRHRAEGLGKQLEWEEGWVMLSVRWSPWLSAGVGYEYDTRAGSAQQHSPNGQLTCNITPSISLRAFGGGRRASLRCVSGVCRYFPAFQGAQLEAVVRF